MAFDFSQTDEERRRRALGSVRQQTTNASPLMKAVQGFTQPKSNFMPGEPEGAFDAGSRALGRQDPAAPPAALPAPKLPNAPAPTPPSGGGYTWSGPSTNGLQYPVPPPPPEPPAPVPSGQAIPASRQTASQNEWENPAPNPGGGGLPQPGPPPDQSGEWFWDGSAWTKRETTPPGTPGSTTPPGSGTPPGSTPPDTSKWNTDGYARPAYTAPNPGAAPPGWDHAKWADPNHQSPKYVIGRILSQYPPTLAGLAQAAVEAAKAYPGTTYNGKDKLMIPGLGAIDVLQSAGLGGVAWQWIDEANAGGGPVQNGGNNGLEGDPPPSGGPLGGGMSGPPIPGHESSSRPPANPGMDEAFKAFMRALGMAVPDAGGLKEASKENLLAGREAESEALAQQIQASGLGRSGSGIGAEVQLGEDFLGNLTKSYRDIDLASQQQGFNNLLGAGGALQGYGAEQFNQQFSEKQLEQNAQQFAAQMGFNWAQMSQADRQFMKSYALNKWIAEQNNNLRILGL